MNTRKKGLGRGLDALLGGLGGSGATNMEPGDLAASAGSAPSETEGRLTSLPLDLIERGRYQPRRDFDPDALRELADSIAAQGIIQPVVCGP